MRGVNRRRGGASDPEDGLRSFDAAEDSHLTKPSRFRGVLIVLFFSGVVFLLTSEALRQRQRIEFETEQIINEGEAPAH
jgi:hypothetical protein